MAIDKDIIKDFVDESKDLIHQLIELLESIEGDFSKVKVLADYGNRIDRIMGGAKSLAMMAPPGHPLFLIGDYTALCKAVGYKGSQIKGNRQFYDICVALLLDATETLDTLMDHIEDSEQDIKKIIPEAFLERLRWISQQFNENYSESVDVKKEAAAVADGPMDINELLKKLGLL